LQDVLSVLRDDGNEPAVDVQFDDLPLDRVRVGFAPRPVVTLRRTIRIGSLGATGLRSAVPFTV
jgi:hypothetical protein